MTTDKVTASWVIRFSDTGEYWNDGRCDKGDAHVFETKAKAMLSFQNIINDAEYTNYIPNIYEIIGFHEGADCNCAGCSAYAN